MRLTDDRYAVERRQFELALRMIRHEARTRTIRSCTGLSDDRIRKLYATYFRNAGVAGIRRRRGKSPRQVGRFFKSPEHQLEATTLVALFATGGLIRIGERIGEQFDNRAGVAPRWPRPDVEFGHRFCRAFETSRMLLPAPKLSFEWAWNLLDCIAYNDELYLAGCRGCGSNYVQDAYALDDGRCPACTIAGESEA